jgi:hypothetical protein
VALYALGERFLVDAGYGGVARKHDMTKKVDRWFGETDVHNCVLVDGMNQRGTLPTPGWAEGEMLDFVHSGDFDTTLGDASAATGPDHAVLASLRRVVLVRRGPAPFVAVIDVNEKDGAPFLAEHLWHTDLDNRVEVEGNVFRILGKRHSCLGQVLWPAEAQLTLADSMGRPQVRVAVRAAVAEAVTVFCPLRAGEDPPRFACRREGRGRFVITCERGGQTATLHAAAATEGPLRAPVPVRLEATARG